jgi:hypothetical protein
MDSKKYIGMDVHKESISIAVMNGAGKIGMECVIETKASTILQFIDGLRGDVQVTFEEGTSPSQVLFTIAAVAGNGISLYRRGAGGAIGPFGVLGSLRIARYGINEWVRRYLSSQRLR